MFQKEDALNSDRSLSGYADNLKKMLHPSYVFLAAAFTFLLTIFAPIDYFIINKDEFWFDIKDMLPMVIAGFILIFAFTFILYVILSRISSRAARFFSAIHISLLIFIFVQGNFLAGDLRRLTGEGEDWAQFRVQNMISLVIIILLTAAFTMLFRKLDSERFDRLILTISRYFLVVMLIMLVVKIVPRAKSVFETKTENVLTYEQVMEFSEAQNLIVFLLDQTDSREVSAVLEETPSYKEAFADFVFFRDAMSGYGHTKYSIPLIFTGKWYENGGNFAGFYVDAINGSKFFNSLKDRGWRIGMYGQVPLEDTEIPIENVRKCSCVVSSYKDFSGFWIDMILYRYLPYCLKKYFEPDVDQLDKLKKLSPEYLSYDESNFLFYDLLQNTPISFSQADSFKYIHLKGAHSHYDIDETLTEIKAVPFEEGGYHMAVRGSMKLAEEFIRKLKENGIYDRSAILIISDHGYDHDDDEGFSESPMLFIKGINEHHPMQINDAPISYEELPDALLKLSEGADAVSSFDTHEGDERVRRFMYYNENDVDHMFEYKQSGKVHDKSTFVFTGKEYIKP